MEALVSADQASSCSRSHRGRDQNRSLPSATSQRIWQNEAISINQSPARGQELWKRHAVD